MEVIKTEESTSTKFLTEKAIENLTEVKEKKVRKKKSKKDNKELDFYKKCYFEMKNKLDKQDEKKRELYDEIEDLKQMQKLLEGKLKEKDDCLEKIEDAYKSVVEENIRLKPKSEIKYKYLLPRKRNKCLNVNLNAPVKEDIFLEKQKKFLKGLGQLNEDFRKDVGFCCPRAKFDKGEYQKQKRDLIWAN